MSRGAFTPGVLTTDLFTNLIVGWRYEGKIDETYIWRNRLLTPEEKAELYTRQLAGENILA